MTNTPAAAALALILSAAPALADGLDFSGTVSMGLQATTINGETDVSPVARFQGEATYTLETDIGVTFMLAVNVDLSSVPRSTPSAILPGHSHR